MTMRRGVCWGQFGKAFLVISTLVTAGVAGDSARASPLASALRAPEATRGRDADCPADSITDFFQVFAENLELQRTYTAPRVETAFVDWTAQPEPLETVSPVLREHLRLPLAPNRATRQREGLQIRLRVETGARVTVVLEAPDTDGQLRYTFRRDVCLTLESIFDPGFGMAEGAKAPAAGPPDVSTGASRPPR